MNKEYLDAFESIMKIYGNTNSLEGTYNYFLIIKKALQRLESIDNAEPIEALEIIKKYAKNDGWADGWTIEFWNMTEKELTILDKVFKNEIPKTGLMDYNPTKHYLKWEDLEFKEEEQTMKVKLNNKIYTMFYCSDEVCFDTVSIAGVFIDSCSQQFFNDLHLERVEE